MWRDHRSRSMSPAIPPHAGDDDELLDDPEAATIMGVKVRTVADWRKTAGLPFIRIGSRYVRTRRKDLNDWLLKHRLTRVA